MKQKILIPIIAALIIFMLPFVYKLPIPADTIPGLYHPMRDVDFGYSNGIPYKNFLTTDPVRQQLPWRFLSIQEIKQGRWPLWNPYNFTGTPLMANFQTAAFYPLNILFFIPNITEISNIQWFAIQWSWLIYLQTALSIYFLYLYLRKIGLHTLTATLGGFIWAFCGFNVAWWEWGNIGHTMLYFPLILYAIEMIIEKDPVVIRDNKAIPKSILRSIFSLDRYKLLLLFALSASFLAGHLQTFILIAINTFFYLLYKIPITQVSHKKIHIELTHRRAYYWVQMIQIAVLFMLIVSIQALPTIDFIQKSARNVDPTAWHRKDWFFPWEHFVTLIAPDYFGNPTTNNYWGVWNYGEFAAYIGIIPLLFALSVIIQFLLDEGKKLSSSISLTLSHKNAPSESLDIIKENTGVGFFMFALLINIVLITRNPVTEAIFRLNIPFLTATQPSRGIAIVDFSLVILAAVGFNQIIKILQTKSTDAVTTLSTKANNNFSYVTIFLSLAVLWFITYFRHPLLLGVQDAPPNFDVFAVAQKNLILPTIVLLIAWILIRTYNKKIESLAMQKSTLQQGQQFLTTIILLIVVVTITDLSRYFLKFTSFSNNKYLYPFTSILAPLSNNPSTRIMPDDSRVMAPNLNIPYQIATPEGYDPLYYEKYGQFAAMWRREKADLSPFPANRIITPQFTKSPAADVASVNYFLSLNQYDKYEQVAQQGQTKLYRRETAVPHLAILPAIRGFKTEQQLADYMFSEAFNPQTEGLFILNNQTKFEIPDNGLYSYLGSKNNVVQFTKYTPTEIQISATLKDAPGLLYLSDMYDEGWKAIVNGKEQAIIRTNFTFRGLQLPPGNHNVVMKYSPASFTAGYALTLIGLAITIIAAGQSYLIKKKSS